MDENMENRIREKQLESYGRLMAGFAHDMKNHLGIIRESNGLMGDLVAMGHISENETSIERLQKAIDSIERRVVIAAEFLHKLSGFAHRSDTALSSFQVNDLLTEGCAFLERHSRLQQITQTLDLADDLPPIYNDPALLHYVVCQLYTFSLEQLNPGADLVLATSPKDKKIMITFRLTGPHSISQTDLDHVLLAAVKKTGGRLHMDDTCDTHTDLSLIL